MNQRSKELKEYLEMIAPGDRLESLIEEKDDMTESLMVGMPMGATRGGAVKTPTKKEAARIKKAQEAVQKLARNEELSVVEVAMVEAIIIPGKRPAVIIQDDDFEVSHMDWLHLNKPTQKSAIQKAIPACGRLELPGITHVYYGSGFVVGKNILMTNRHVAEQFTNGIGRDGLVFKSGYDPAIDFKEEHDGRTSTAGFLFNVRRTVMIHPYWDMALLEVEGIPEDVEPLKLSAVHPEDARDDDVAVIGYPAQDSRNSWRDQQDIFKGIFNVKRMMPGKLRAMKRVKSYGNTVDVMSHDPSTLGGASGSVVWHLNSKSAIGLHFAGREGVANYAVPAVELARDPYVREAGVLFDDSAPDAERQNPWRSFWDVADSTDEGVTANPHDTPPPASPPAAGPAPASSAASGGTQRWTIPIHVDISVGSASAGHATLTPDDAATPLADAGNLTEKMVEPTHDPNYNNRTGYDPDFLGISVPMPEATDLSRVSKLEDGTHELLYYHFSVVMDRHRRLPVITAANVDARDSAAEPEPGKTYTRHALNGFTSDNDREKWFTDPRIPAAHQLPDRFFTKDRTAFDKGHVVRRNDVVWGNSYKEVQWANGDTFHVTNCTPQVLGFNRSNRSGIWGKLENHVYKEAGNEQLNVFAAPVLNPDDRMFFGVDDEGPVQVRIPEKYWKVVVARKDDDLQTFAFIMTQSLDDVDFGDEEFTVSAEWEDTMISLSGLEQIAPGVKFPDVMHDSDMFGKIDFDED